ncbi:histidine phosphatase family protein [Deinococcus kurensis]|uniref:histidine phosphatase family protein n=1 Tax=Deinococcus kurensis TaxID=2662757 RepID=UPI001391AD17|nr:histidine phosphatase family protein [Deinococcus kurensis]
MQLLLIRHAQSANNLLYQQTGAKAGRYPDPHLTPLGHRQAQALADAALDDHAQGRHLRLTHLHASLTVRAVQTAAPLARALGLPVHAHAGAHEVGGLYWGAWDGERGPLPGETPVGLRAHCPSLRWPNHLPPHAPWDGGFEADDPAVHAARARRLLGDLRARHGRDDRVGLVTHQRFAQYLIAALLGSNLARLPAALRVNNAATCAFDLSGDAVQVGWLNRHDHLGASLVTT